MRYFILFFALCFAAPALAQTVTHPDPVIEQQAREVGRSLRCVVCQNQSIEDSDAPLAQDMRKLVRERLEAGDTQVEVIGYMQERYGDYVLLKPPVQGNTYALWFAPFLIMLLGLLWFFLGGKKGDKPS